MFATLRRCPASVSRNVLSAGASSRALRAAFQWSTPSVSQLSAPAPRIIVAAFHASVRHQQSATATSTTTAQNTAQEPAKTFEELSIRGLIDPVVIDTVLKMGIHTMTEVQARTINEALSGVDIIGQAKTGTGKTLGFLIPTIQRILNADPSLASRRTRRRAKSDDIKALIISPTRELAEQIAVEAKKVTANTGIVVQTAVGGSQKREMLLKTRREGCHILVGTPGRLCDLFTDPYSGIAAPGLQTFIMDEADRLLDMGFEDEINRIKEQLPDPKEVERQSMMFSATIPRHIVDLVRSTLKPGFHFAQCVDQNEPQTHERVPQKVIHVKGLENIMPTLYEMMGKVVQERGPGDRPFKAIVYFNSTAEVKLATEVYRNLTMSRNFLHSPEKDPLAGVPAYEIHSKLTQMQRTRASDRFRMAKSGILFSSDVTARGMDFPNVTHVIQVGTPRDRETYIHRIGRTGRAGKEGEGWLFATPLDSHSLRNNFQNMPLEKHASSEIAHLDLTQETQLPENVASIIQKVQAAHQQVDVEILGSAFAGMFGAYQGYPDKQLVLEHANRWALHGWGMPNPPNPPTAFMQNMRSRKPSGFGRKPFSAGGSRFGGDRFSGGPSRGGFGSGPRKSNWEDRSSGGEFGRRDRQSGGAGGYGSRDRQSGGGGGYGSRDRQFGGGFGGRDRQTGGEFGDRQRFKPT